MNMLSEIEITPCTVCLWSVQPLRHRKTRCHTKLNASQFHFMLNSFNSLEQWLMSYMAAHTGTQTLEHTHFPLWIMSACLESTLINGVPKRKVWECDSHTRGTDLGQLVFRKNFVCSRCLPRLFGVKLGTHLFHSVLLFGQLNTETAFSPVKPNEKCRTAGWSQEWEKSDEHLRHANALWLV